ncbi:hypothetical protein CSG_2050 [Campylobacter fetus subsp. venerealis str. 84-112]|uniref:DUF2249 domain-containing protein n=3 Tax=Campylobacter fetus TaxID=196 RepID=A0RNG6_CAMFF|nr:conserved hypothetical protein [Campylobacter fetus subsp. fetus 82-40]CDF64125.1 hypothetical protein CSG_2050 [Campylobacter fetus subsp. venerealis str. 84-112]
MFIAKNNTIILSNLKRVNMNYFENWQKIKADGASLDFYKKTENQTELIGFDSSRCIPPEPMVNAVIALNFIKDKNIKVVMINHKFPAGLIPKIEDKFDYTSESLEDGNVRLIFSLKDGAQSSLLDTKCECHG